MANKVAAALNSLARDSFGDRTPAGLEGFLTDYFGDDDDVSSGDEFSGEEQ